MTASAFCTVVLVFFLTLVSPRARAADWAGSFPSAAVKSYLARDSQRFLVVAASAEPACQGAAQALAASLQASAGLIVLRLREPLGRVDALTDEEIVQRAAELTVDEVVIVRVFPDSIVAPPAPATRQALVTFYDPQSHQPLRAFRVSAEQRLLERAPSAAVISEPKIPESTIAPPTPDPDRAPAAVSFAEQSWQRAARAHRREEVSERPIESIPPLGPKPLQSAPGQALPPAPADVNLVDDEQLQRASAALAQSEQRYGHNDSALLPNIKALALLHEQLGNAARAQALWLRAVGIAETLQGAQAEQSVWFVSHLAEFYQALGLLLKAEETYQGAITRATAVWGANAPQVGTALGRLAELLVGQGEYTRAEPLFLRAVQIQARTGFAWHAELVRALLGLGAVHAMRGDWPSAEALYQSALSPGARGVSPTLMDFQVLEHLARLRLAKGDRPGAQREYEQLLIAVKRQKGDTHPDVAPLLFDLARLLQAQRELPRAARLYTQALDIAERTQSRAAVQASILFGLAGVQRLQGNLSAAATLYQRAFALYETDLRQLLTESRVLSELRQQRAVEESLYSLVLGYRKESGLRQLAMAVALLRKGRAADEGAQTASAILEARGQSVHLTDFAQLQKLRNQQATLLWEDPEQRAETRRKIAELEVAAQDLERRLALLAGSVRKAELPTPEQIVPRVAQMLPEQSVLVEIVSARDTSEGAQALPARYLALLLFPDARIEAVDLGEVRTIDQATAQLLAGLQKPGAEPLAQAQTLYRLIMAPLVPLLQGTRHLLLSLDGNLNLVPFAALHDQKDYLISSYYFSYLTSGRDLLRPRARAARSRMAVFADPDYFQAALGAAPSKAALPEFAVRSWPSSLGGLQPLPGTRQEAERLKQLVPAAELYLGRSASRRTLLTVRPEVLHVATHGVFLGSGSPERLLAAATPAPPNYAAELRGLTLLPGLGAASPKIPLQSVAIDNPLARSALLLAGAAATGTQHAGEGLVTGLDVTGMNLWGTRLVVLSACETGRGAVESGQGVYGLRRAFFIAGAETLVTSLWQVSDAETSDLMERFYQNLLRGEDRGQAMQKAALWMKGRKHHPYYWAPFISIGRDAPLPGLAEAQDERPKLAAADELRSQAAAWSASGRYAEALGALQTALGIREAALGPTHRDLVLALGELAALQRVNGQLAPAEQSYRRALDLQRAALDPGDPALVETLANLGALYEAAGSYERAAAAYRQVLDSKEASSGPTHRELIPPLQHLAFLADAMGDSALAIALLQRAVRIQPEFTATLYQLAALLHATGDDRHAKQLLRRALALDAGGSASPPPVGLALKRSLDQSDALRKLHGAAK